MKSSAFETELTEGLRSAVKLQRQLDPVAADGQDAMAEVDEAARVARGASDATVRIVQANSLEDATLAAMRAVKAHEEARDRFKALKRRMQGLEAACEDNARLIRDAMAPVMQAGVPDIEDEHHYVEGIEGSESLEIYDPSKIPPHYLVASFDNAAIKADLKNRLEVPGARLVTGPPSIRIKAKTKTKGRKSKA